MIKLKILLLLTSGLALLASCSNNDDEPKPASETRVELSIQTTATFPIEEDLPLQSLLINISGIEFQLDKNPDKNPAVHNYQPYKPEEFKGPFMLDLLSNEVISGKVLGTAMIPNGTFEEIEFELDNFQGDEPPDLKAYSVFAKAVFHGIPIVIQIDSEESVAIDFDEDAQKVLSGKSLKLKINFDLDELLKYILNIGINATDGNKNGIVEIKSDGTDGNKALADQVVDAMGSSMELTE